MGLDCWIIANVYGGNVTVSIVRVNQVQLIPFRSETLYVSAPQHRLDNVRRFGVGLDQLLACFTVYDERLVVACLDPVVNLYVPVLERCSLGSHLVHDAMLGQRHHAPGRVAVGPGLPP